MNNEIMQKLELFVQNSKVINKKFTWHEPLSKKLCALLYALENQPISCDDIVECHTHLKGRTKLFSAFRGDMSLCISAMLALDGDCEKRLDDTFEIYRQLREQKLRRSDFLCVAACQIALSKSPREFSETVQRMRAFYDGVKESHFFLTAQDDYIFMAMLALSDIEVEQGVQQIERIYQRLKPEFWVRNSIQALAQILTLVNENESVFERLMELRRVLKAKGVRMDKTYTFPSLGLFCLLPASPEELACHLIDVKRYLRAQKGFGIFSADSQQILLYAAAIISISYFSQNCNDIVKASLATNIINIILAQQAAVLATIAVTSTVASAN